MSYLGDPRADYAKVRAILDAATAGGSPSTPARVAVDLAPELLAVAEAAELHDCTRKKAADAIARYGLSVRCDLCDALDALHAKMKETL